MISWATADVDEIFAATDLFLLGLAHRRCRDTARQRLEQKQVELPDELPSIVADEPEGLRWTLHEPPPLDACPFCGKTDGLTQEHVIPKWVSRRLREWTADFTISDERSSRKVQTIDIDVVICAECNNRWLSVLENDVARVLSPMLDGSPARLMATEQSLLATWAVKTALMLDLASGNPFIPQGFYFDFRLRRAPHPNNFVWLANYGGNQHAATAQLLGLHIGVPTDQPPNAFLATFSIFRVVFQVLGHFARGPAELKDDRRQFEQIYDQIWPWWCMPIVWPKSTYALFEDSLNDFATSFSSAEPPQS